MDALYVMHNFKRAINKAKYPSVWLRLKELQSRFYPAKLSMAQTIKLAFLLI